MSDSRVATGVRVGIVASATTVGAVIGLGLRHGLALRPFLSVGRALLDKLGVSAAAPVTTIIGLVMAVCAIIVLGVCFTVVAAPLRGLRLLGAAIMFGAIGWAVSAFVVPSILALSNSTVLGDAQRVFIFVLLALSLAVGMRLARPRSRIE